MLILCTMLMSLYRLCSLEHSPHLQTNQQKSAGLTGRNPPDPHWLHSSLSGGGAFFPSGPFSLIDVRSFFAACVVFLFFFFSFRCHARSQLLTEQQLGIHTQSYREAGLCVGPYLPQLAQSEKAMRQRARDCIDHELLHSLRCTMSSILHPFPPHHAHTWFGCHANPPLSLQAHAAILQHWPWFFVKVIECSTI